MPKRSPPETGGKKPAGKVLQTGEAEDRSVSASRPSRDQAAAQVPIVVIGASAGGLDAMARLLDAIPADTGMAFLLIQHLDPYHASQLVELLATHTRMRICEAAEGMAINPNEVYVSPPGYFLAVRFGVLHLSRPLEGDHIRLPIDFLVRSLAEECGPRSVCIILSGTGSDGSGGLPAFHKSGGRIIVQSPEEAEHDGMPRSAVLTGLVDAVVPLVRIPQELAKIGLRITGAGSSLSMLREGYDVADI